MRVVIAKKLLSTVGGSEAQARALAKALHDRHHEVTLVGLRPAGRRPGIGKDVVNGPSGPVERHEDGVRYLFIPVRGGRLGAAVDGILPTSLAAYDDLAHALSGADVVHSIAREWVGSLERAAREAGAAFVETPLVHPGQRLSGSATADIARFEGRWRDARWIDRGVVSEEEKAEAFARATVFAMPSVHETFGHTYLEAWYAWRPVIAGDIPPVREIVRDGIDGLIVAQEPGAIARAIVTLLGDPLRARRMGESGRF